MHSAMHMQNILQGGGDGGGGVLKGPQTIAWLRAPQCINLALDVSCTICKRPREDFAHFLLELPEISEVRSQTQTI